jgi:putative transposase
MKKTKHNESEMVKAVRELESGVQAEAVSRGHDISKATLYNWKSKYSGMDGTIGHVRLCIIISEAN